MTKVPQVLGELIEDRAARNGDRVFLRFKDQKFTYNEMNRFANRCANALTDRHVVKGDKISHHAPQLPGIHAPLVRLREDRGGRGSHQHVV